MKIIKEPKNVDFIIKSTPWSEEELIEFRKIMANSKKKKSRRLANSKKLITA
jgi:hypothetical protein